MNANIVKTEIVTGHIAEVPTRTENREGGHVETVPLNHIFVKPGEYVERQHKQARFGLTRPALGTERKDWLKASNVDVHVARARVGVTVQFVIRTDDSGSKQAFDVIDHVTAKG